MKALGSMILVVLLTFSLSACAKPGAKKELRIKCPACGHEFETPSPGRGGGKPGPNACGYRSTFPS